MNSVDFTKLTLVEDLQSEDASELPAKLALVQKAKQFVAGFAWCGAVERVYAGMVIPPMVGTFLVQINATKPDVDRVLWVIVGDIPPAYLVVDEAPSPSTALEKYIELMSEWVDAVEAEKSVETLIPVNAPPTKEYAAMLRTRLTFLRDRVLLE